MPTRGTFECLKYSFRQSKDGVVIAMLIHPSDVSPELMALPIGARVEIEWTECTDEEPDATPAGAVVAVTSGVTDRRDDQHSCDTAGNISRDGTRDLAPVSPAVLPRAAEDSGRLPKDRRPFAELPLSQQCAIRCADKGFWKWLGLNNADDVTGAVRGTLRVKSRSELDHDVEAAERWRNMDRRYNNWLTTANHGDLCR